MSAAPPRQGLHESRWPALVNSDLRWDDRARLWFAADQDVSVVPPLAASGASLAGEPAGSPLIAQHVSGLNGPILMIGSAPTAHIAELTAKDHDVVVITRNVDQAGRLARKYAVQQNVAVVLGTTADLTAHSMFGAVISLDPIDMTEPLAELTRLLAPEGHLVMAATADPTASAVRPGRAELVADLSAAGLPEQEWALLFGDPAAPSLLISTRALVNHPQLNIRALMSGHTDTRSIPRCGNVERALAEAASCLLVVARSRPATPHPTVVHLLGSGRRARFLTSTRINHTDDGLTVCRQRRHPALPHTSGPLAHHPADEPYVPGQAWSTKLDEIVTSSGWTVDDLVEWFGRWADELTVAAGSGAYVEGHFLDAIPRNMIVDDDQSQFVDLEWTWTEPLLRRVVVFRALLHSLGSVAPHPQPGAAVPTSLGDLILSVAAGIGEELSPPQMHEAWDFERHLQHLVTGIHVPPDHLDRPFLSPTTHIAPAPERLNELQLELAGMGADNDALRADLESLLTELDATRDLLRQNATRQWPIAMRWSRTEHWFAVSFSKSWRNIVRSSRTSTGRSLYCLKIFATGPRPRRRTGRPGPRQPSTSTSTS